MLVTTELMRRRFSLIACLACLASVRPLLAQVADTVSAPLLQNQYDLSADGRAFLLKEAAQASFFMLGELHGEISALIREIWPPMWQAGYRHVAAEFSPWAAARLERPSRSATEPIRALWSQEEATFVASFNRGRAPVLWGCDMEEAQPHLPIRDLAAVNPGNRAMQAAAEATRADYTRRLAPELLERFRGATGVKDLLVGGLSLRDSIVKTLEIEVDRLDPQTRLAASLRREALMKELFHRQWQKSGRPRVLLRFGRNHLHRGYDRRGVPTLGNFVAELAVAHGVQGFNLAAFAAGPLLHRIPEGKRSPVETSLAYWADSYDAVLCYREVTPRPH
jgi:hypothetical protein